MWCFLQVLKRGEGGCFYKQAVFNRGFKDSMCSLITILCETYRQTILLSDQRWGREVQGEFITALHGGGLPDLLQYYNGEGGLWGPQISIT